MDLLLALFRRKMLSALLLAVAAVVWADASPSYGLPNPAVRHRLRGLLVGYLPNSSFYSATPFYVRNLVRSGSAARLDQIDYASASVRNGRCSLADPVADLEAAYTASNSVDGRADSPNSEFRGYFHQLQELKRVYPRLKLLISLEGRAEDLAFDARPENRAAFVNSCVDLYVRGRFGYGIEKPGLFDGVDIDWESPGLEDAANFRALIEEFRRQMNSVRPGLLLSVAVDQSPAKFPGTDFAALAPLVDEFGIMNYDYAGPWNELTGFLAPLFSDGPRPEQAESIQRSIAAYRKAGVPARKLLMGLPFYGYGWTGVSNSNHGLFQAGQAVHGDQPYRVLRTMVRSSRVYRDPRSRAPWIFDGQNFWTFEDPVSVRYKVSYASRQKMGGVMIWELSGDTADAELLNAAYDSLRHPLGRRVFKRATVVPSARSARLLKVNNGRAIRQ